MLRNYIARKIAIATVSLSLLATVIACNGLSDIIPLFGSSSNGTQPTATASTSSQGGSIEDYVSLVDSLRTQDVTVEATGEISQDFFSVGGKTIDVNGESIQIFEYASNEDAEADAGKVSPDGGSIGTSMVMWVGTPHFYKKGKLIVLYVGDSKDVIAVLTSTLGPQFAGR